MKVAKLRKQLLKKMRKKKIYKIIDQEMKEYIHSLQILIN